MPMPKSRASSACRSRLGRARSPIETREHCLLQPPMGSFNLQGAARGPAPSADYDGRSFIHPRRPAQGLMLDHGAASPPGHRRRALAHRCRQGRSGRRGRRPPLSTPWSRSAAKVAVGLRRHPFGTGAAQLIPNEGPPKYSVPVNMCARSCAALAALSSAMTPWSLDGLDDGLQRTVSIPVRRHAGNGRPAADQLGGPRTNGPKRCRPGTGPRPRPGSGTSCGPSPALKSTWARHQPHDPIAPMKIPWEYPMVDRDPPAALETSADQPCGAIRRIPMYPRGFQRPRAMRFLDARFPSPPRIKKPWRTEAAVAA